MGLKLRHDTAANWTSANPTLELSELGYETNTGKWKVGDGATAWVSLAYMVLGAGAQPLDADLTTIAGLTATTDNIIQAVAGAWASRTPAQVKTALAIAESDVASLVADLAAKQPLDSDLTTIAGLTATTDNFLVAVASAWASRTPAQVLTTLGVRTSAGLGVFGDGSDGVIAFDGTTAALAGAWTKSGSTYTLLRDIYPTTVTLSSSAILVTAGFRVFAKTSLTVNSGSVVHNDGGAASGVTAGAAGAGSAGCTIGGGSAGGNGGTTSTGFAGTALTSAMGGAGATGGAGGSAGGAGGAATVSNAANGQARNLGALLTMESQGQNKYTGGSGGGGGGGQIAGTGTGGGGGGGAGALALYALTISNSGTIRANGGVGGNGVLGSSTSVGGGAGGGGGFVAVLSGSANNGTVTASGGVHGNGAGTGANGADGAAGTVVWIVT